MSASQREKVLFIVNPRSGKMNIKNELYKIIRLFSDSGYEPSVLFTTAAGDASEFAFEYGRRVDRVVACGGDGTLNEVVSGIMRLNKDERPPIGFIPSGTTNDLAETLKIPKTPIKAAMSIIENQPSPNDVGFFNNYNNTRYFNYIASCGAFTSASYATPQNIKNSFGHMAYVLEGVKSLSEIKPIYMKVESDEVSTEGHFIFAAVTNSLSVGGIYKFDPKHVNLNDGVFEVLLIRIPNNVTELIDIFHSLANLDYDEKQALFFHSSSVKITCEEPVKWTVDGEYGGKTERVVIQNLAHAVNIFKPLQIEEQ